ncbi:hypothetical protein RZE82_07195 [Mollicutes bacterium LVI A0039]|nr:hypothetical protein RZE82_07195 [Mollicutes bacterium LVI A0039]
MNKRIKEFQEKNKIPNEIMELLLQNSILKNDIENNLSFGTGNKKLVEFAKGNIGYSDLVALEILDGVNLEIAKKINQIILK